MTPRRSLRALPRSPKPLKGCSQPPRAVLEPVGLGRIACGSPGAFVRVTSHGPVWTSRGGFSPYGEYPIGGGRSTTGYLPLLPAQYEEGRVAEISNAARRVRGTRPIVAGSAGLPPGALAPCLEYHSPGTLLFRGER